MGGKSSQPAPPDYVGAAQAQGAANKDAAIATAQLSNPNITNPYGTQTVTYKNDPVTGNPVPYVNQALSPDGKVLFDQYQNINKDLGNVAQTGVGYVQDTLNKPFDWNSLPTAPVKAGQTYADAAMERLNPQIAQERNDLETQLANQGINVASNPKAYENAYRIQNQRENDLRSQVAAGSLNADQAARSNAIQEQEFARTEPLNILNSVRSSAPVNLPQFQGYQGTTQQPTPIMQGAVAQGQANQNIYNQQVAQQNAGISGLFGLGGSAAQGFLGSPYAGKLFGF